VEVEGRSVSAVRADVTATAPDDAHHSGLAFTGITMIAALIGAALLAIGVVTTQRARVRRTGLS